MRRIMYHLRLVSFFIALSAMLSIPPLIAFAQNFSSGNFTSQNANIGNSGGSATSSSFSLLATAGQSATGVATSTSFILHAGFLYFDAFAPMSENWRWYNDPSDETPTSSLAVENTAPSSVNDGTILKLRWTIKETAGTGEVGAKFRLQYSTSSSFQYAKNLSEQSLCTVSSEWCYANGAGADGTVITTGVLSDSGPCVASVGVGCGTHNTSGTTTTSVTQAASAASEYEFTVEPLGAIPATAYFFRAVDANASSTVSIDTGKLYPSLSTGGGTFTFTIEGLPSATTTSGVTTDVNTTPNSVPFGALLFGSNSIAAHRFTVSTNATNGYNIYAYERQGLVNDVSDVIPPVNATNAAPAAWTTGCVTTSSSGCWGYHTNASVLSGGSTRFAPDDTYAQFTSSPSEIAYSATPATNQSTDIVYRIEATNQQQPGDYTTQLVYILTPTF